MRRIPLSRGVYLLPNLCTTVSLFFGFFSIVRSLSGDFYKAAMGIYVASFFDMLDGRLARMTRTESDFGVEYDSLVDLASFGLAPGVLLYLWSLQSYQRLGWLAAFLYFACGALRLARYNVQVETIERKRFQGLPIPGAALLAASLVILYQEGYGVETLKGPVSLAVPFLLAPLMVSRIRYRSFKDLDLRGRRAFSFLLVAVGVLWVIGMNPEVVPFFLFFAYVLSGPIEELIFFKKKRREKERERLTPRSATV